MRGEAKTGEKMEHYIDRNLDCILDCTFDCTLDIPLENGAATKLKLHRLSERYVAEAAKMCDRCVGKNLYTKDYLASIIHQPEHFFYLLLSDADELAGYMYFILMDRGELASISKLDAVHLDRLCKENDEIIGNLRSIGVEEPFRGKGLSMELIGFSLSQLASLGATVAVGLCWKHGTVVPMRKTMLSCGFQYLTDARRPWYDIEGLECPYCSGRCECDAEVYYKRLEVR